jgi:hypothetical protein
MSNADRGIWRARRDRRCNRAGASFHPARPALDPSHLRTREANAWSAGALSAGSVAGDRRSDRAIAFAD